MERFEGIIDTLRNIRNSKGGIRENGVVTKETLELRRRAYYDYVAKVGDKCLTSLSLGMDLARALEVAHHGIECHRLLTKLLPKCRWFHGPAHDLAKTTQRCLLLREIHMVQLCTPGNVSSEDRSMRYYKALRYEDDGNTCVLLQSYMHSPFSVTSNSVHFDMGVPVIYNSLKGATHLNGKIGDVRSWDNTTKRYGVHFEDQSLDPAGVKQQNLRIVFDLPNAD